MVTSEIFLHYYQKPHSNIFYDKPYIKDLSNFDDLLVILDIRMKNLNGFQLHQQIKAIDPAIKIFFITALDILDELLSIVPGISKEQIMRKPVDENKFTNTVKKLLK